MADVTISNLDNLTPTGTSVLPISNGVTTGKATINQILGLQSGVPSGFIGLWSGAANAIPAGWFLCNGNNGTPNLVDRFVVGAGTTTPAVNSTGGSKDAIVVSHTHTATDSGHTHTYNAGTGGAGSGYSGRPKLVANDYPASPTINTGYANITVSSTGSSGTNANLPPYYALCYIMKA